MHRDKYFFVFSFFPCKIFGRPIIYCLLFTHFYIPKFNYPPPIFAHSFLLPYYFVLACFPSYRMIAYLHIESHTSLLVHPPIFQLPYFTIILFCNCLISQLPVSVTSHFTTTYTLFRKPISQNFTSTYALFLKQTSRSFYNYPNPTIIFTTTYYSANELHIFRFVPLNFETVSPNFEISPYFCQIFEAHHFCVFCGLVLNPKN